MVDQFSKGVMADTERHGNIVLAILAGIIAAVIGSGIWMGVEVGLNLKSGIVALGVGALVGFTIRFAGHGSSPVYGIIGAVLTLAGCLGGEILTVLYAAATPQQGMLDLARSADYVQMIQTIVSQFNAIDYIIYAVGIYEGYKFSIVK
jgi:hypothetical protein